jgi:DNA replication protein DnaC
MSADSLRLLLKAFRLPTMAEIYERVVQEAEQQGWGYRKFLLHLCEAEAQDRAERKLERLLKQSGLPGGKNLGGLEEAKLPVKVRRVLPSLLEGGFVTRAENVIALGLPGRGKSHFLAALGRELILRHKYAVLFTPTFKLVQQLLAAKRDLRLEELLRKLDHFDAILLADLGHVKQDREEMEVLFKFLAERYERRSVLPTHLPPFAHGFPRERKLTQLIDWSGLGGGCSGACGWLFLETTPAPPTSAAPPALRFVPPGSCRPAATTLASPRPGTPTARL